MVSARKVINLIIAAILILLLTCTWTQPVFASAPSKEKVKYKGSGVVEVDFTTDVKYKKSKVTVKDSSGKSYKVSITKRGDDEIKFKVKKYKAGKKYSFVIKGVRKVGTSSYGKVKGKFKIPKAKSSSISAKKAKSIAINHAVNKYGISRGSVSDTDVEKDYYDGHSVWEVSFDATRKRDGEDCEYEYKIRISNGKILHSEEEWDD